MKFCVVFSIPQENIWREKNFGSIFSIFFKAGQIDDGTSKIQWAQQATMLEGRAKMLANTQIQKNFIQKFKNLVFRNYYIALRYKRIIKKFISVSLSECKKAYLRNTPPQRTHAAAVKFRSPAIKATLQRGYRATLQ